MQDVLTRYFEEEARFVEAVIAAGRPSSGVDISPMSKSANARSGFCKPNAGPLVVACGGGFGAHLANA